MSLSSLRVPGVSGTARSCADARRFTPVAQALHWLSAILMITVVVIAWHMKMYLKTDDAREFWYYSHESLGVTILALTACRLVWRKLHPPPAMPGAVGGIEHALASASHWCLYAVLIAMPISGYCIAAGTGHSLPYFFLITIPPLLPKDPAIARVGQTVHALGQWGVYGLFALHVLATGWHVAVRRDGTLDRMLPPQNAVD